MVPSASIPAVRQNRSKLTETASQALPTAPFPVGGEAIDVVLTFFMALLSFVDSTPRAYRLKASNAAPPISTFPGAIPLWTYDGTLERIHHALYEQCREREQREASPTAAIIDSQSVKSAEKGGRSLIRTGTMRARRSRARSGTFLSTH